MEKWAAPRPPPIRRLSTCLKRRLPSSQRTWPKGLAKEAILARLDQKLQIPAVTNIWTQPIRNRIDMLSTGIRTQIGIKVFGPDLRVIEAKSEEIKRVVGQVPGAVDLYAERTTGSPYLEMTVDRPAADRYGLNVADVEDAIEAAISRRPPPQPSKEDSASRCTFAIPATSATTRNNSAKCWSPEATAPGAAEQSSQHPDNHGAFDDQQ